MGAVVHVSVTTYYSVAVVVVVESFLYYLPVALSEQLSSCTVIMSSRAARSVGYCRSLPVFPVRGSCLHLIRLTRLSHRVHCQVSSSPFSSQDEFSYLIVSFCFVFFSACVTREIRLPVTVHSTEWQWQWPLTEFPQKRQSCFSFFFCFDDRAIGGRQH